MMFKSKKILVTGGHGFLGSHVVAALESRGADPKMIGNRSRERRVMVRNVASGVEPARRFARQCSGDPASV